LLQIIPLTMRVRSTSKWLQLSSRRPTSPPPKVLQRATSELHLWVSLSVRHHSSEKNFGKAKCSAPEKEKRYPEIRVRKVCEELLGQKGVNGAF